MTNKISGEEKHYQKLNKKLTQELKVRTTSWKEVCEDKARLYNETVRLKAELDHLNEENLFLKSKVNLSNDDIQQLLKSSKVLNQLNSMTQIIYKNI